MIYRIIWIRGMYNTVSRLYKYRATERDRDRERGEVESDREYAPFFGLRMLSQFSYWMYETKALSS